MAERDRIDSIVERIVGEILQAHTVQLKEEIVRRITEEVGSVPATEGTNGIASADLAHAVSEIQAGSTQREILRALLDACARYAARVALFVVKAGSATGWQGRGFSNNDSLKDFALDVAAPAVSRAVGEHSIVNARAEEIDQRFLTEFGSPGTGEARLLPLVLKDKVAALVYADGGTEAAPHLDAGSLELLVLTTSAWLELNSLRKQVQKGPAAGESEHSYASAVPVAATPASYSDPFAAHAPGHAMAAAAAAETMAPAIAVATPPEPGVVESEPPLSAAPAASEPAPQVQSTASSEEQEVLRKAQRFARLLIDEIKLYNQAKVAEGRKNKDLYDRLKEAIEKSRATYQKRYGNTVAASSDYFQHELVSSLAEDDISIMGANFPH
jgi:hypothetical protein